jgi:site-specific recombinase XerD
MARIVQHLRKYLSEFHSGELLSADMPLFYSIRSGMKNKLTDCLIRYMLQKYGQMARTVFQDVPENVHPHLFRHSRAMHLYQEGVDLTLISQ